MTEKSRAENIAIEKKQIEGSIRVHPERAAAEALMVAALQHAAQDAGMSLQQLVSLPAGRQRRRKHDDITVVVVVLDEEN